jgi:hypothetical protein
VKLNGKLFVKIPVFQSIYLLEIKWFIKRLERVSFFI